MRDNKCWICKVVLWTIFALLSAFSSFCTWRLMVDRTMYHFITTDGVELTGSRCGYDGEGITCRGDDGGVYLIKEYWRE